MNPNVVQNLKAVFHPLLIFLLLLRMLPMSLWYRLRVEVDGVHRTFYGYGLLHAADLAKKLGIKRISALEFGVAAGNGLVLLEKHAAAVEKITGVKIDIYGFDLGVGLPAPSDYRDLPYVWQKGFYKMDKEELKKRLQKNTKLVLGDVKTTVPKFLKEKIAPIGYVTFDLDFYSSTKDAFKIFDAPDTKLLPRIFCYFDEVVGNDHEFLNDYVGELLAINEFNEEHKQKKLTLINGLQYKRILMFPWNTMIYIMHDFKHKEYDRYVYHTEDRQIQL